LYASVIKMMLFFWFCIRSEVTFGDNPGIAIAPTVPADLVMRDEKANNQLDES